MIMRNDNLLTIKKGMTVKAQRAIIIRNWVYLPDDQQNGWENVNNYGYMTTGHMLDITQEEVDREYDKQFNWM